MGEVVAGQATPELLPARMLNEYTYCPRLFHLEWSGGLFRDNEDTVEGSQVHRRVDREAWTAGDGGDDPPKVARSVLLSSEELGIIAKVDLLERDGEGAVRPVDYKRGKPAPTPEQAWEPERVQVCAQVLLLRANDYVCHGGELWFSGARRRVPVEVDDELVARTRELIAAAHDAAADPEPPSPLVDSPKCPRCSLVSICLPDEVNLLAARADASPRRIVPRRSEARPVYVSEQGARVGVSKGRLVVRKKDEELASLRLVDVSQVCLTGNVQISTQAVRRLMGRDVPVAYFSYGGWFQGMASGLPSKHVHLRYRQVVAASRGSLPIARQLVVGKIHNARTLLRRNSRASPKAALEQMAALRTKAETAADTGTLLGIEGAAARTYFGEFDGMFADAASEMGFHVDGRNRRPPKDPVNALLSYVYGLLVKDLTAVCHIVGFDPFQGFYHRPRFGRPALALDLAEEFRPLIGDSVVLQVINNGEVTPRDFVSRQHGVGLTKDGRRAVQRAYERRLDHELTHPTFGYRASYRRVMEIQVRVLAAHVLGEVPEYVPVMTR